MRRCTALSSLHFWTTYTECTADVAASKKTDAKSAQKPSAPKQDSKSKTKEKEKDKEKDKEKTKKAKKSKSSK